MAYQTETSLIPFWAESRDFVTGRDPLGIQNSSVSIYTALLPGLNNVTDRLRYYGFYCWLLMTMEDRGLSFASALDQHNYIRKAEYTLALYMAAYEPLEQGIAGSAFAIRKLNAAAAAGSTLIDVAAGAEKLPGTPKGSVYWDFSAGILGQYYAGSLQNGYQGLGLIALSARHYFITQAGRQLGSAYGSSISAAAQALFFRIVETGWMNVPDAAALSDFSIARIAADSEEGRFYRDMFFSADFSLREDVKVATRYRQDSLVMLAHYLKTYDTVRMEERSFNSFPEFMYLNNGLIDTPAESDASVGWFYYATCERMHISLEHLFYTLLLHIQRGPVHVNNAADELCAAFITSLAEYYPEVEGSMSLGLLIDMLEEENDIFYEEVIRDHQYTDPGSAMVYAMEYLLVTFRNTEKFARHFADFAEKTHTRLKNGTALDWMDYIKNRRSESVASFFKRLLLKIINDHLHVAYAKMGSGELQVHKFLIEDNFLIHINTIMPRYTSPRLRVARNFLRDMRLLAFDPVLGYTISAECEELLAPYQKLVA